MSAGVEGRLAHAGAAAARYCPTRAPRGRVRSGVHAHKFNCSSTRTSSTSSTNQMHRYTGAAGGGGGAAGRAQPQALVGPAASVAALQTHCILDRCFGNARHPLLFSWEQGQGGGGVDCTRPACASVAVEARARVVHLWPRAVNHPTFRAPALQAPAAMVSAAACTLCPAAAPPGRALRRPARRGQRLAPPRASTGGFDLSHYTEACVGQ